MSQLLKKGITRVAPSVAKAKRGTLLTKKHVSHTMILGEDGDFFKAKDPPKNVPDGINEQCIEESSITCSSKEAINEDLEKAHD